MGQRLDPNTPEGKRTARGDRVRGGTRGQAARGQLSGGGASGIPSLERDPSSPLPAGPNPTAGLYSSPLQDPPNTARAGTQRYRPVSSHGGDSAGPADPWSFPHPYQFSQQENSPELQPRGAPVTRTLGGDLERRGLRRAQAHLGQPRLPPRGLLLWALAGVTLFSFFSVILNKG